MNVKSVVILPNFLHFVVGVNDERERGFTRRCGRPRPQHDPFDTSTKFDGSPGFLDTVHLKGNGEGIGFHISKVEERCRELYRVVNLRNTDVHVEIFWDHFGVRP